MTNENQTKNPFTAFGIPARVVVNGVQERDEDIADCIRALLERPSEIKTFTLMRVGGIVKLYVATY